MRNKNSFKLSICIATYNREKFIGETLDSIIPQITEEVEIIILDGASTDNTSEIVQQYQIISPQIKYFKELKKGGVDQDYCKAVQYASGEMCWLFTDDDLMKPDAIKTILNRIEEGFGLIIVDAEVKNVDFSKTITKKRLLLDKDQTFRKETLNDFFNLTIHHLSFIGAVIINRKLWLERKHEPYFGTEFIHVGVLFQEILDCEILVLNEPQIIIRLGNAQWTSRAFEIWLYKWPNLIQSFDKIKSQYKEDYSIKPSYRRFKDIVIHRAEGSYSYKSYLKWFRNEPNPFIWKFIVLAISILPRFIAKTIIKSYLIVKY